MSIKCPYGVEAGQNGKFWQYPLSHNFQGEMAAPMLDYCDPEVRFGAVEFSLPENLLKGIDFRTIYDPNSFLPPEKRTAAPVAPNPKELDIRLAPFQAEIFTQSLSAYCNDYWKMGYSKFIQDPSRSITEANNVRTVAKVLEGQFGEGIKSVEQLRTALVYAFNFRAHLGERDLMQLKSNDKDALRIGRGSLQFDVRYTQPKKRPQIDRDLFFIVMGPFYPENWWRYSPNLKIVVSKQTDFQDLSQSERDRINTSANRPLLAQGIALKDPTNFRLNSGLFVPALDIAADALTSK